MVSPWQRRLLVMAGAVWEGREEEGPVSWLTPESVLVAVATLALLVLLVLQCACRENSSRGEGREKKASSKRNGSTTNTAMAADSSAVVVDIPAEGEPTPNHLSPGETSPVSNGVVQSGRNGVPHSGHSRNASSGSGQMRPTSLRELPDLPVSNNHKRNQSGQGGAEGSSVGQKDEDGSGYDHLGAKISTSNSSGVNYDHIHLESPRDLSSGTTPQSEVDTASEGHYTQVRERTYDVVKDVRASAKVARSSDYDPYAKVKDEEEDDTEDTYAKVRDTAGGDKDPNVDDDDGDYSHLRMDHVLSVNSADKNSTNTTAASTLLDDEDPYERVIEDSGGAQVLISREGNNPDDPYSLVNEQAQATVVSFGGGGVGASPLKSSGNWSKPASSVEGAAHDSAGYGLQYADEDDADGQNDYATVVKDRSNPPGSRVEGGAERGEGGGAMGGGEEEEEIDPYSITPPEPPRLYGESEVDRLFRVSSGAQQDQPAASGNSREHRYSKVTARESLASMSARNALNTYEVVPELPENTYATVDGGSGDGVVRYATPGNPNLQLTFNEMSETYAEIGASGSGGYAVPAPEPPSLDSLHSMTKSTTSNDDDHPPTTHTTTTNNARGPPPSPSAAANTTVIVADDGYAVVSKSGFSPSETALPQIPGASSVSGGSGVGHPPCGGGGGGGGRSGEERVMIGGVTLHADYHSVKDCVVPDPDNENDPNYESVDEALSRSPVAAAASSSAAASAASASSSSAVMAVRSTSTSQAAPRVTIINHTTSPSRGRHQYEEVSPPSSPLASSSSPPTASTSNRVAVGAAAPSNGPSSNGASSNGVVSKGNGSEKAEAAEVRDRVLQGHMYEDISEVKKRNSAAATKKTQNWKKPNSVIDSVKL